jgi:hypothetical protein
MADSDGCFVPGCLIMGYRLLRGSAIYGATMHSEGAPPFDTRNIRWRALCLPAADGLAVDFRQPGQECGHLFILFQPVAQVAEKVGHIGAVRTIGKAVVYP